MQPGKSEQEAAPACLRGSCHSLSSAPSASLAQTPSCGATADSAGRCIPSCRLRRRGRGLHAQSGAGACLVLQNDASAALQLRQPMCSGLATPR